MTNIKHKAYMLDTSIILDDTKNILRIYDNGQNYIFISNIVLAELNNKKDDAFSEVGFQAREFFRITDNNRGKTISIDELPEVLKFKNIENDKYYLLFADFSTKSSDDFESVPIYVVYREEYRAEKSFHQNHGLNDAKIAEITNDYNLKLLTNDISFKISAQIQGLNADSLKNYQVENANEIEFFHEITYKNIEDIVLENENFSNYEQFQLNEIIEDNNQTYESGVKKYAFYINKKLELIDFDKDFGENFDNELVKPMNIEQKFYFLMMTRLDNYITVAGGSTGSGKTLIALQAGLKLFKDGLIDGIIYARNTVAVEDRYSSLGFRKGDEKQKLGYFMYPLYNAINFTIENMTKNITKLKLENIGIENNMLKQSATENFMQKYNIETIDIAHLRGTTISRKFVIIDESQNMTTSTLKLIGTRIGEGTRLLITGDINQIDHPYLFKTRNALSLMLKKAKDDNFIAGIQLRHTIRSKIADWFDKQL
ncbi:MAG: PhoH family protein [Campylobacterales bacterium]|nr:PhoH family protein [Campylobacterales bacterium]